MSLDEVQVELDEQARWGLNRTDRAVVRLLVVVRFLMGRSVDLEQRVSDLERRLPPP
jgi:hypothetical protein